MWWWHLNLIELKTIGAKVSMRKIPFTIHGSGIFAYIWLIFVVNVGKYISPMDAMFFFARKPLVSDLAVSSTSGITPLNSSI